MTKVFFTLTACALVALGSLVSACAKESADKSAETPSASSAGAARQNERAESASGRQANGIDTFRAQERDSSPKTTFSERTTTVQTANDPASAGQPTTAIATLGSGCFWCTEAIFQRTRGVVKVVSGYSGGSVKNPTYKQVCEGTTGHAECVQITYNPQEISYDEILEIFWKTHDPTTLNRQGNDVGTQYRSVIFYHNEEQKRIAEKYKRELDEIKAWSKPIVTEITAATTFYPAEDYHQNYFNDNPGQGYCAFVIRPKVEKFESVFTDKIKKAKQ